MEIAMVDSLKIPLVLVGRILIAFMFMQSGYEKLTDLTGTAGYIASGGLPNSTALAGLTGVFELVAGLAILIGFRRAGPRWCWQRSRWWRASCITAIGPRQRT